MLRRVGLLLVGLLLVGLVLRLAGHSFPYALAVLFWGLVSVRVWRAFTRPRGGLLDDGGVSEDGPRWAPDRTRGGWLG